MIQILIIDDNPSKIKAIRTLLDKNSFVKEYDVAQDTVAARKYLQQKFFDLVILDLKIPKRAGDDPSAENCMSLLKELNQSERLIKPSHIIGLTEFDNLKTKYEPEFDRNLWMIILYNLKSTDWEEQLSTKLEYLIKAKYALVSSGLLEYQFDVAFISALRTPELDSVLRLPLKWETFRIPNDSTEYNKVQINKNDQKINILAIAAPQMGMVASSVLTMKVIHSFRPRFIVMTGIAAGVKSKSNYGDLLITELSFDYTSGKQKSDKTKNIVFEPDYKTIELSRELLEEVQISKAKREFLDEIKNAWPGNKPPTSLEIHIGPLGSGGGVIADDSVLKNIQYHSRKLIGLDMETYGLYYACNNSSKPKPSGFISIKSVSDFSGIRKNDKFQKYASYTSATFAYKFFMEKIL